ncbi:mediator of RNA polymerase II transcription subunit 24 isoform X2 [Periplaneta americana]|uniref:mediator of RNA polymerase II transcription subunit 24 isoform X2 n=1 Tax=Periplaneta americana TaxID=6978 RepID=UPI0037E8A861
MRGPLSSMTSKTSSLKALLLRAWRERWSDLQWGIHIKTILPRGVSGDVYNLADCILQQALVGPGPNQLVVSYLKHSLSSQLVSYAAVLQRISKYDGFHKPHCIISLLEFLEAIQGGITCRGKPEEGLLAAAVLSIVQWLLTCMQHALKNLPELKNGNIELTPMLDKPAVILAELLKCDFLVAMLYLAKHECRDVYHEVVKKCQEVEALMSQNSFQPGVPIGDSMRKLCHLDIDNENGADGKTDTSEPVTYCLQALLAIEALLNPSSDTQMFVNELLMVQRLKGYNMPRLYSEIMRACLITLNDVQGTSIESQWGAFTFLKVPHILRQLHFTIRGGENGESQEKMEFSQDVVDALELLLQYTPLLDIMDAKCSCNCIECLLKELLKNGLVTESHVTHFTSKRETMTTTIQKLDQSNTQAPSIPKVIVRAEPTLSRILKTLDADYAKVQEALLSVLCQVLTGKSFELILAVAAVEGKLRTFVTKLLKFNECSKQIGGEGGKASQTRAMLFDVTFLMLCSIVHTYGPEVVLSEEGGDSFFEQWVRECMVERGRPKSPDQMLQHCDPARVDALLSQFNSADGDFKTSQVRWHEVCLHVPAVIKEVLLAWEHGAVTANDVKRILDAMRSRMCCLPVCAAAWLCSYMQILHQDALLKPMNMVQQFLTPLSNEEMSQQDNFKERSALMFQIIRKMQYDVHPPTQSKVIVMTLSHSIISRQPISEQLESVWAGIQQRGWVNIEATHSLESLLNTGGSQWFVTNLVKEVLKFRYKEDLDRAVDLAFGVFHLDIEHCTLALLLQVLPQYLHNRLQSEELVEPQASALAKLCAYCVFAALEFQSNTTPGQVNSRKRSRRDMEGEDLEGLYPSSKLLRMSSGVAETADTAALFGTATSSSQNSTQPYSNSSQPTTIKEPLQKALNDLFHTFTVIAGRDGEVSQQTHFVCKFLQFVVRCGRDRTRLVLQGMPNTLVPCLLRSLPDLFTTDLLLRLYDINTVAGRKATARDLCMLRNMDLKMSMTDTV